MLAYISFFRYFPDILQEFSGSVFRAYVYARSFEGINLSFKPKTLMNALTDLKSRYIQRLKDELSAIEKATASFGLSLGGVSLQTNADTVNNNVEAIAAAVNKGFVEEINGAAYAADFPDDMMIQCYEEFRSECSKILSDYTKVSLSAGQNSTSGGPA